MRLQRVDRWLGIFLVLFALGWSGVVVASSDTDTLMVTDRLRRPGAASFVSVTLP